jgi:hypothetical protein
MLGTAREVAGVGASTIVLAIALGGCVPFLPSDPAPPPAGVREDDGVLSVIVRRCQDDEPLGAEILSYESHADDMEPSWTASGYIGGTSDIIRLDSEHWQEVEGSYQGLDWFGLSIDMSNHSEGTEVREDDPYRDLGPDDFLVNDKVMTADEFRRLVAADFPCMRDTPTGSRS